MARKRKKAKKRKVVTEEAVELDVTPDTDAAPEPEPTTAPMPPADGSADAVEGTKPAGAQKRKASELRGVDEVPEVGVSPPLMADEPLDLIDLSVDDDLDDADVRAQLIADVAGLVIPAAPGHRLDSSAGTAVDDATDSTTDQTTDGDQTTGAGQTTASAPLRATSPPPPRMTRDALVALSEMHAEGIATIAGERVLDLGEGSSSEDRDRLLAAALAQVEMQDAIYRVPTASRSVGRWKAAVALSILLIAGLVALSPPGFVEPDPPPALRSADRLHGVRVALLLEVQQIEAFRSREQRLPDTLDEVGASFLDIRYVKSSNRLFQLVAWGPDGEAVVYDSASPEPEFEVIRRVWVTTRSAP